jgi:hypothetical protein
MAAQLKENKKRAVSILVCLSTFSNKDDVCRPTEDVRSKKWVMLESPFSSI